jgi:hypothetical protein
MLDLYDGEENRNTFIMTKKDDMTSILNIFLLKNHPIRVMDFFMACQTR